MDLAQLGAIKNKNPNQSDCCAICARTLARHDLFAGGVVRPSLAELIHLDHPDRSPEKFICQAQAQFFSGEGTMLLPMLELIERAETAVDELIEVAGQGDDRSVLPLARPRSFAAPRGPGAPGPRLRVFWYRYSFGR